MGGLEN